MDVKGKTVAVSGSDSGFRRKGGKAHIKETLQALGAKVTASVSSRTSLLIHGIVGADAQRKKARELGVAVMNEAAFYGAFPPSRAKKARSKPAASSAGEQAAKKVTVPRWRKSRFAVRNSEFQGGRHENATVTGLSGVKLAILGTPSSATRAELEKLCVAAGAKIMASVGASTQLVVACKGAGRHFANAIRAAKPIIDEVELNTLLGRSWPMPQGLEGPLGDWLPRFLEMVATLRANKRVAILNLHLGAPATEAQIEAADQALCGLPPGLANLYRQCNGLSFRWIHDKHPAVADKDVQIDREFGPLSVTDVAVGTGGYEIPCLDRLTMNYAKANSLTPTAGWTAEWAGETLDHHELASRVFTFDQASRYQPFHLCVYAPEDPVVFLGDDHGGDWEGSKVGRVEDYLEATLAHFASFAARPQLFGDHSSRGSKRFELDRAHWEKKKNQPSLRKVLALG